MSDASFDDGKITIEPPLNYAEIKKVERELFKLVQARRSGRYTTKVEDFRMRDHFTFGMVTEDFERETAEGLVKGMTCSALRPNGDYLYGYMSMADEINQIADIVPGHNFTGEVIAITEENQSAIKVVANDVCFKGNRASVVNGKVYIKFDDGTTADGDF